MARDPRHDILFEPVKIGPKTLRNRFYQVPHCTGFGVEKPWSQARHRAIKAEGGWAAVCTEYAAVSPDADETPYVLGADLGRPRRARMLAPDVRRRRTQHGALAGIELCHTGVQAENSESRLPSVGPSQIASDFAVLDPQGDDQARHPPLAGRLGAAAARRSRDAGFDIVYAYGAHTYLLGQFLSPYYNRRTDEYGGSLDNRARLWLEVLEAVRRRRRRRLRDRLPGGGRPAATALGRRPRRGPRVHPRSPTTCPPVGRQRRLDLGVVKDSGPSRFFAEGWQLDCTGQVRQATAKPIVGVGRLTNPDLMAEIVRSRAPGT